MLHYKVHEGLLIPTANDFDHEGQKLLILEDLYEEVCESLGMSKFFTFLARSYH